MWNENIKLLNFLIRDKLGRSIIIDLIFDTCIAATFKVRRIIPRVAIKI